MIIVTVIQHPQGALIRIERDGHTLTLDRDEAFDLHDKLNASLGEMPVTLSTCHPTADTRTENGLS